MDTEVNAYKIPVLKNKKEDRNVLLQCSTPERSQHVNRSSISTNGVTVTINQSWQHNTNEDGTLSP
jgi:hypothetical protein